MATAAFFVAAVLLSLGSALAQTTQPIHKVVPTLDKIQVGRASRTELCQSQALL